jgi:uncharacterized protein YkwD
MRKSLFRLAGIFVVTLAATLPTRPALAAPDLTSLADQVFVLVNQQRVARGLPSYARVSPLDRSAQDYAQRMATEDFFSHIAPDGETPAGRILAAGYSWSGWGENIAAGLDTAAAVMDAWMHSPGHAANILSADYSQIGIGVAVGGTFGIYWVQDFGSPFGAVPGPWVPRVDRLSAATSGAGDLLTLDGADFGSPGGVSFNGVPAYVEQWSTSRVSVRIPAGGTGPVVLTNAYGSSTGLAFGDNPPGPTPTPAPPTTPPTSPPTPTPTPTPTPPTPPVLVQPSTPPATPTPSNTPSASTPPSTVASPPPAPASIPDPAPLAAKIRFDYIQPRRGRSGTMVQLIGAGFGASAGQVKVNGGSATVLSWSDTEIDIQIEGSNPGRKGVGFIRSDGRHSPLRLFRQMP